MGANGYTKMSPRTTKYHSGYGLKAVCDLKPKEAKEGKLRGGLSIDTPTAVSDSILYEIAEARDLMVAPFEIEVGSDTDPAELRIRITGDKPKFSIQPITQTGDDLPTFSLYLPPLDILPLCTQYLEEGLTTELVADLQETYNHPQKIALHEFMSDAKNYFEYDQFLQLQKQVAEYDGRVRKELAETRHRMFKNMLRGQKAGDQFPVTSVTEFQQRLEEYERKGLDTVLGDIDGAKAVEIVIDIASSRGTYLDEICEDNDIIAAFADSISTGHFINSLSQALIEYAPSEADDITADTIHWQDSSALDPKELILRRFNELDIDRSYDQLRDAAYESYDLTLFKRSLAAATELEPEKFHQAAADLLYWYTEITSEIQFQIRSRVYGVAEGLYRKVGNTYMTDAAYYRKSWSEGVYRQQQGDYRAAGMAFSQAYDIATQKQEEAEPFDEINSFLQIVETNIRKHRDKGEFLKGLEEAQTGLKELRKGPLEATQTGTAETLLEAWEDDLIAQHQQQDGRFEEAIETTGDAIAGFRQAQAEPEAQTAQTRRLQLEAITSQLALDFEAASEIHQKAAEEIGDTNRDTAYFHECQSTICDAKQALLDNRIDEAKREMEEIADGSVSSSNFLVLIETRQRYDNGDPVDAGKLLKRLETPDESGSSIDRHISYDGDYVSAAMLISAAQTLKETEMPTGLLDQIIRAVLKDALSGESTREWQEISELSRIDTGNTWRLLIPSVFIEAIEDIDQMHNQPAKNYAAPAMELLAALEGYLRILTEYYARLQHEDWRAAVETRNNISMADLEMFFASDPATDRIESMDIINQILTDEKYFDTGDTLSDVRNDLDHNNRTFVDERTFTELKDDIYEIMRASTPDLPVVAEIIDVREHTRVHSASLDWSRLPRRIDFQIAEPLEQGQIIYLPPEIEIESGFADVDDDMIVPCTAKPDDSRDLTS